MKLKDKVAVITGGASGIGRSSAILFAREGANVVIADVSETGARETIDRISEENGKAIFVKTDVTQLYDCEALMAKAVEQFGSLDILYNNAGVDLWKPIDDTTEEEWDRVLDTNLKGTFLCSKFALRFMMKNKSGSIVSISSIRGLSPQHNLAAYSASKAGIILITKSIALDYARYGIRANCICPGQIRTPMYEASPLSAVSDPEKGTPDILSKIPLARIGKPEDVANAALFLVSDEASFITGETIIVDGGRLLHA